MNYSKENNEPEARTYTCFATITVMNIDFFEAKNRGKKVDFYIQDF